MKFKHAIYLLNNLKYSLKSHFCFIPLLCFLAADISENFLFSTDLHQRIETSFLTRLGFLLFPGPRKKWWKPPKTFRPDIGRKVPRSLNLLCLGSSFFQWAVREFVVHVTLFSDLWHRQQKCVISSIFRSVPTSQTPFTPRSVSPSVECR